MTTRGHWDDAAGQSTPTLSQLLAEVADCLRRLPESRLNKVAGVGRDLAQALADAAAGAERREAATPPPDRAVPVLSVFAVADQVAVTGRDLEAAAVGLEPTALIWWQGEQQALQDVLQALAGQAKRVRSEI